LLSLLPAATQAAPLSYTFFEGTQFPLTAYFLSGAKPGPTAMVQGGIQGDEVSGFVAAQLLTRSVVHRGNLLIVPRANLPSIHARKRLVNVDLNRRFDRDYNQFYEDRLARAIRFLMGGCDAFIHLHEGSGFYSPKWVDALRNPKRWGQSIIIDASYTEGGMALAGAVNSVLGRINPAIVPADYRFRLFNTDTFAPDTAYPEQRKSLTYYAMDALRIPAMAVEVSKNIHRLGWKVNKQLETSRLLLSSLGVEVSPPYLDDEEIEAYADESAKALLNGRPLSELREKGLELSPGSRLALSFSGPGGDLFEPGHAVFASDRPGLNLLEAPRLALSRFDELEIRADGERIGVIPIRWKGRQPAAGGAPLFACWLNGELVFAPAGSVLEAVEGDRLVIEGVWGGSTNEILNFKGFVSHPGNNDGQDMGTEIILDPENFILRYMERTPEGLLCRIVRETPGKKKSSFKLLIKRREVLALELLDGRGRKHILKWNDGFTKVLPPGKYTLADCWSNGERESLTATRNGRPLPWDGVFTLDPGAEMPLTMRHSTTFKPIGRMLLSAPNS
jgi:hypothetical protein